MAAGAHGGGRLDTSAIGPAARASGAAELQPWRQEFPTASADLLRSIPFSGPQATAIRYRLLATVFFVYVCLHGAIETRDAKIMLGLGGMSRDLSPAEFRICRMVFAFLAIMVFAFLVFDAIDFLFSLFSPAPPVRTVQMQPGTTRSTTPHSPAKPLSHSSPLVPQKQPAGAVVPADPAPASLSYMKTRLEQLGQMTLEKSQSSPLCPRRSQRQMLCRQSLNERLLLT
jgi:hypothetical protein